ncbi:MAG: hypothetical protein QM765_35450 [Myxococcales bacterium]
MSGSARKAARIAAALGALAWLSSCGGGGGASGEFTGWPGGCACAVNPIALQPWATVRCVRDGTVGRGLNLNLPAQANVADWVGASLWAKSGESGETTVATGPALVEYGSPDASHTGQRPLVVRRLHLKASACDEGTCGSLRLQESVLVEALFWCTDES